MSIIVDPSLFYNPYEVCRMKESYLPLLDQQGKLQFVTFRCIDSIPVKQREELKEMKETFEKNHPKPWSLETLISYRKIIGAREENLLDAGYGQCLLKNPILRKHVENAIEYFNGERYDLHAYVIMPNHVHILMVMLDEYLIEESLESIKKHSAIDINNSVDQRCKYWDGQNYCRLIRNQDHYDVVRSYINKNPRFLRRGEESLVFEISNDLILRLARSDDYTCFHKRGGKCIAHEREVGLCKTCVFSFQESFFGEILRLARSDDYTCFHKRGEVYSTRKGGQLV